MRVNNFTWLHWYIKLRCRQTNKTYKKPDTNKKLVNISSGALMFLATVFPAEIVQGQTNTENQFINLEVTGPLTPEARKALNEIIAPSEISNIISKLQSIAAPIDKICTEATCKNKSTVVRKAESKAALENEEMNIISFEAFEATKQIPLNELANSGEKILVLNNYVAISNKHPIAVAAGLEKIGQPVAVPNYELGFSEQKISGSETTTLTKSFAADNRKISLIEEDLEVAGRSIRQFRINPFLSPSDLQKKLQIVRLSGAIGLIPPVAPEQEGFTFIHPENGFDFETSGGHCGASTSDWPFNVKEVVKVINFGEQVRHHMGLGRPVRTRILILDTGIGRSLLRTSSILPLMYQNESSVLMAQTVKRKFSAPSNCRDTNNSRFWADLFGAGAQSRLATLADPCGRKGHDILKEITPLKKKPNALGQVYDPHHGSYVAGLSVGGPELFEALPSLPNYVGLSVFRLTRSGETPSLSVKNDPSDLEQALIYAQGISADIVNLSLRTKRHEPFEAMAKNSKAILVTSAGNSGTSLDIPGRPNRPANLDSLRDRMIVVGALQNDRASPFWQKSDRSAKRVHIAAPGVSITSFNNSGQKVCSSGTSAAAPLVTFTAAMIKALTSASRNLVRSRVLSASDNLHELKGVVEDERALNIPAALDVFVDRIEFNNNSTTKRGWIEPNSIVSLFPICQVNSDALVELRGAIDLSLLWEWRRNRTGLITIRHQLNEDNRIFYEERSCKPLRGTFKFHDLLSGAVVDVKWADVKKILPSPFRAVKDVVLKLNADGSLR